MSDLPRNIETIGWVVHDAKEDFKLEELILDGPQDDELLVDMKFSGICHTDLTFQQGDIRICEYPAVFGHEGAGTIRAIGPKVKNKDLKVGDFVLLSINFCEECKWCKTGHPANCTEGTRLHLFGVRPDKSTAAKLKSTGQSETCVVKYPYPPEDAAICAAMGCGYQTGAGTVMNVLKPSPDSSLVVFGLGTVGLTAVMGAKYLGVKKIIAVDIQPLKFPTAKEVGATHIVNSKEVPDIVAHIKELTGGVGADYCVDCTGVPKVIEDMLNCLSMLGTAATFLLFSKKYIGVREGDSVPEEYIPKLVEMQRAGQFPVEKIVKVYDYKDMHQALHDMHEGTAIKPVIKWS